MNVLTPLVGKTTEVSVQRGRRIYKKSPSKHQGKGLIVLRATTKERRCAPRRAGAQHKIQHDPCTSKFPALLMLCCGFGIPGHIFKFSHSPRICIVWIHATPALSFLSYHHSTHPSCRLSRSFSVSHVCPSSFSLVVIRSDPSFDSDTRHVPFSIFL